jgi:hypothetical protein
MKQKIRLTESNLLYLVESTVKRVLTEMGTPAQNSLLRKLTGTNEYDNLSVSDASEKISSLLDKQNSNSKPSEKQLAFISRYNFAKGKDLTFLTKREASQIIQSLMARDITRAQRAFNAYYQQSMHNQFDNTLSNGNTPYLLHSSDIARLVNFRDTYDPSGEEEFSKRAKRILDAFGKSKDKFVFCNVWDKERPYYWVFNTGNSIQFNKPIKVNVISPSDFGEINISFYTWYIYLVDKDKGFTLRKPEYAEGFKKLYGLV